MLRLSRRVQALDNDIQPLQPLAQGRALATSGTVTKSTAIDSTCIEAHRSAHGGKGVVKGGGKSGDRPVAWRTNNQNPSTKIHALTDVPGRPFTFKLTPGNAADSPLATHLLAGLKGARYLPGDKGCDANSLRNTLRQANSVPVIPGRRNRQRKIPYDKQRYKDRHLVENAFCRLKDFPRMATRYHKRARNLLSAVAIETRVAFRV